MIFERIAPEQHDTLDGVPEPSETPRLVGHRQAADMLTAAYRAGKLPHALIFSGPIGIGKATTRRSSDLVLHLTRPLNDKTKSFKTVVTVDEIRKVSRFLSLTSHDGSYRVVIVDPADDMNTNAANALLKNLEEPPARTLFILIVHAPGSLLPTIRSRCQVVRLTPLDADDLMAVLETTEPLPPDDPAARAALVGRAGGSARNAILLTQYGGLEIASTLDALVTGRKSDVGGAFRLAEAVAGRDQAIQFDIFNRRALDLLSDAASQAALAGDLARAKTLSDTWHEALDAISETDTYNLDKKQHALTMIDRLNSAMRM
ncbi:DNA polymerase III subunit delta' [Mesorhizobium sp. LNHC252B00]|uniref:DNA polymerase III subunit delta' n=1 Tax=Mesorhizobium sp. LNHC252B00 TaxID=1287252 RepID=UPI0003CEDBF5|nr:DNA polymerase III subunit delta' [Mesorhizobium sp. LNHC252B00]ESY74871.1 DNA polymerase III subunit delta' [Mesorhizobium sp. LNHC252B00]